MEEKSRVTPKKVIAAVVVLLVVCGLIWMSFNPSSDAQELQANSDYQPERPLDEMLDGIPVSEPDPEYGYSSVNFPYWLRATDAMKWPDGTNRNCNARMASLYRDGEGMVWANEGRCVLGPEGHWTDLYAEDGITESPNMDEFEVDHIVSTQVAWRSGAREMETGDREAFSNDPLNLQTASIQQMVEKDGRGASEFIPEGVFRCEYVSRYIQVKDRYGLHVTENEENALSGMLEDCGI